MALHLYEEESPYGQNSGASSTVKSNPVKRIRWATHRANTVKGNKKRQSILDRFHHRRSPSDKTTHSEPTDSEGSAENEKSEGAIRTIYFNRSLPESARDEEGHPTTQFVRNKIRTSKYTPLSFVPKNLWFQFHNIANVYFLFIIILSIFSIFGASNPGLNAVPLIVILVITAIKDAVEDFRRTILDNQLNNSPVHRLVDWNNVNTAEDQVSAWRKFKKANTRAVMWLFRRLKTSSRVGGHSYAARAAGMDRPSLDTRRTTSFQSARLGQGDDGVELTPVHSTGHSRDTSPHGERATGLSKPARFSWDRDNEHIGHLKVPNGAKALSSSSPAPKRFYGSLIDAEKQTPEKARFAKQCWKNVQVGDFVRLYNEEQVPADIVVLSTSDPDGACYVETKNLDGETNLKVRQALHCGTKIKRARDCERTDFYLESEPPHANLYSYNGVVRWHQRNPIDSDGARHDMAEPISINNLLLRGCSLRNTEWVLGVVIFTGEETKIMLNAGITPSKRARISRELNYNVIYNFIILFFMCLIAGVAEGSYFGQPNTTVTFFEFGSYGGSGGLNGFITFWAAVILFQNLVPISLYISLEIIRTFQAYFIYSDAGMYYEKLDYPCTPKSWNISDDLGQIEYIFSDKTGTLTQNVMEFRKATINGIPYGEAYTEAQAGLQKRKGVNVMEESARAHAQIAEDKMTMLSRLRRMHDNPYLRDADLTFVAPDFVADLAGSAGDEQQAANSHFMLALALCHTVITERTPGEHPRIEFKAQSPDEAALVATARDCGFTVIGRSGDSIIVNIMGVDREYTVLNTLEFNSSRKRMSSIIRMPDSRIILFCKGADSVIYSRLRKGEQSELRRTTAEHLEAFAREGLRTLCIAQRELGEEEYEAWSKDHDLAAASVQDRDEKLESVSDAIERDLTLLGGTAIEDRLQDGVPDTIALLANAGIKLWVLTGDKVETAINIGFSCNLLNNDMDLILFKPEEETMHATEALLNKHLAAFGIEGSEEELRAARNDHEPPAPTHAIVIDGDSLKLVLDEAMKTKFLLLCKQCKSVLCCRVSPSQKAAVVQLVRRGLDVITLSIGDGANDVAMIQEADVGVGIAGEEGRQAVMTSDFAIGQFRFLARLTLVHGRWCYRRLSETIANFFYKNIVWTFALFWYQIYDNFDCSYIFDYTYILLYNLAFTSLPVIFMGILDQDVSDRVSLAVPQLYRRGIERKEWTQPKFWIYMIDGLYQSVICFFMAYLLFSSATFNTESGRTVNDNKRIGIYIANATVVVVNVYVLLNTYHWNGAMVGITLFSILLVWFWTGVYTAFTSSFLFYEAAPEVYGTLAFWAQTLLTVTICLLPRFCAKAYQKIYLPRDVDVIREQVRQGKFKYLDTQSDPTWSVKEGKELSPTSSEFSKLKGRPQNLTAPEEDERPLYPPSAAPTGTTRNGNPHSQEGSDETMSPRGASLERVGAAGLFTDPTNASLEKPRPSFDRPRPSFDRIRTSMDRLRPSFEQSHDLTTAAYLTRVESSHEGTPTTPQKSRLNPFLAAGR